MELNEIKNGESRTLEFKKELPQDSSKWIKTIVAFANGAGGKLLIGVSNKGEVIGIPQETDIFSLRDKISDTIGQMCEPQIMFDIYQESVVDKVIVVVEVFPGNDTPYYIKSLGKENGTFIRLNATTRNADFTTLDELELRKKQRYYGELPMSELEVTDSDIEYLCADFFSRAKTQITKEKLLNMHLIQKIENSLVATNINDPINDSLKQDDLINDPINLFDLIKQNPNGNYEDYAQILKVSSATIKRKIAESKAEGKIIREGSNKNGYWKILGGYEDER